MKYKIALFCLLLCFFVTIFKEHIIHKSVMNPLVVSDYVTISFTIPEPHADKVREAMGKAGAGKIDIIPIYQIGIKR